METNGVMPFWDEPFDINSNQAIVGFDSDQSFVGGGFTLVWNSHKIVDYDFTFVHEAHEFVTQQAEYLFGSVMFDSARGKFYLFEFDLIISFRQEKVQEKISRKNCYCIKARSIK